MKTILTGNIRQELDELNLPAVTCEGIPQEERRPELLKIIQEEYMGIFPDRKEIQVSMKITEKKEGVYGGKASETFAEVTVAGSKNQSHTFPIKITLPKGENIPVLLYLMYHLNQIGCGEELVDNGFGLVQMNYADVEPDDVKENFTGFAGLMPEKSDSRWGKIACWAFAASCIMDVLHEIPEIDCSRVAVTGHSRLGMTALLAGAMDERFALVAPVHSGALHRGTKAESFQDLSREYTKYWFGSGLFKRYKEAQELPFDNHFLIALCAPRRVYISGATEDLWCDPYSLILSGTAASPAWEAYGEQGLILPEEIRPNTLYADGKIAYYLRTGTHYFGRDDLLQIMKLMKNE